eukprot:Skav224783  [mRNA]  locus=scaffold428:161037:167285:- [translate_table: standard]
MSKVALLISACSSNDRSGILCTGSSNGSSLSSWKSFKVAQGCFFTSKIRSISLPTDMSFSMGLGPKSTFSVSLTFTSTVCEPCFKPLVPTSCRSTWRPASLSLEVLLAVTDDFTASRITYLHS